MTAVTQRFLKCDRSGCGVEYHAAGSVGLLRLLATADGWYSGRDFADARRLVDYCPAHRPVFAAPQVRIVPPR